MNTLLSGLILFKTSNELSDVGNQMSISSPSKSFEVDFQERTILLNVKTVIILWSKYAMGTMVTKWNLKHIAPHSFANQISTSHASHSPSLHNTE